MAETLTVVDKLKTEFRLTDKTMAHIALDFKTAMLTALAKGSSPLKMLPSYLPLPSGKEAGLYLALDFGGTNIRVLLVELFGDGCYTVHAHRQTPLKDSHGRYDYTSPQTTAEELFAFIAGQIGKIRPSGKDILLGHTFSFPSRQTTLSDAYLITWTKELQTAGVENRNVTDLLTAALKHHRLTRIHPIAVINDTVGTLLTSAYTNPHTDIGSICGTGHNTAYLEPSSSTLINMESGNFNQLPLTSYDAALDAASEKPGAQLLEKCVAGHYLGELLRLIVIEMVESGLLPEMQQNKNVRVPYAITAKELSLLITDRATELNGGLSSRERIILKEIAILLRTRSAQLTAATFYGALCHIDPNHESRHHIAIDGSLFEKMPGYADALTATLNAFDGRLAGKVSIGLTKGGSGIGAAIAAAIAGK